MKYTTEDKAALELFTLTIIIVSAIILHFLLGQTTGVLLLTIPLITGVYFVRRLGWAMRYCRSRSDLHPVFATISLPLVFIFGLGGFMLLVNGIRFSSFRVRQDAAKTNGSWHGSCS